MKWILTAALAMALTAGTYAQTKGEGLDAAKYARELTDRMTQELNLTPEQAEKVGEINTRYMEKALTNREKRAEAGQSLDKVGELAEMNKALEQALTEEQYRKWQQLQTAAGTRTKEGQEIKSVKTVQ